MINRYPGTRSLSNKTVFADMMRIAQEIDPEGFNFIPPTFVLPGSDLAKFEAYRKAHLNATFIAKPDDGSGGDAIALFKKLSDLPGNLRSQPMTI